MDRAHLTKERGGREGRKKEELSTQEHKGGFLSISPLAPLPLLCFLMLNDGPLFPCALLAALFHELGHIIATYMMGGRVVHIGIYPFGAEIITGGRLLSYGQSLFVALAGVGVNLACALLPLLFSVSYWLQVFSICSLGLALFNLLPLKRLDGGEALYDFCALFMQASTAERVCRFFSFFGAAGLFFFVLSGVFFAKLNPTFLLLALYLLWGVF